MCKSECPKDRERIVYKGTVYLEWFGDFFFFFKQKTAYEIYQCDWSSDVCSSDLPYYGYARQDRKVAPRVPITAKVVAEMIMGVGVRQIGRASCRERV